MWFFRPGVLGPGQVSQLADALANLSRKKADPTPGRIVAAVSFGFWVTLLSGPYEHAIWQPDGYRLLAEAFPHMPSMSRKQIHTRFNQIRDLRNRVFHHEELWRRQSLERDHEQIHEAIGWISPTLQQAILSVDSFPEVFRGRAQVTANLRKYLDLS